MVDFKEYLVSFEQKFIVNACSTLCRTAEIPVRSGRLSKTKFAELLGLTFKAERIMVIDYYGYNKMSTGFVEELFRIRAACRGKQVRTITAGLVYFASIKMEDVAAGAPELVADFPTFKDILLKVRGFKGGVI